MPETKIICQDALKWMKSQPNHSLDHVVTGIPDLDETPFTMTKYIEFFEQATDLIFKKIKPKAYAIFMVTDRKYQKRWIDKSYLLQEAANRNKIPLLWHKILLFRPVGSTHIQRPTFQHYLCFSYQAGPGEATPDVMPCGKKQYKNATCPTGIEHSLDFIQRYSQLNPIHIVDPFVGRGTTLVAAQKRKFTGTGIDLDPKQCRFARQALNLKSPKPNPKSTNRSKQQRSKSKSKKISRKRSKTRSRTRS